MSMSLPSLRTAAIFRAAQERIKDYIVENQLGPGDPLPTEFELSRQAQAWRGANSKRGPCVVRNDGAPGSDEGCRLQVGIPICYHALLQQRDDAILHHGEVNAGRVHQRSAS